MAKRKIANKECRTVKGEQKSSKTVSFRLKCQKTANGLSHFVMYGDVPKEKTLL